MKIGLLALLGIGLLAAVAVSAVDPAEPFHIVVVDPGHGGPDFGARGSSSCTFGCQFISSFFRCCLPRRNIVIQCLC